MASLNPGSRLGRYEVRQLIGRGGMAAVYKAQDPVLGRDVAIKVLSTFFLADPGFLQRFTQEAQTVARLRHPNILQVYDFGEDSGHTYIVTELVNGGTLHDLTRGPLPPEQALRILRPLAEAIDYAHCQGVVHRDIKPSNVLIDADSRPILADFGLSRVMQQAYHLTAPGEALGTPEYMSPEQALGQDTDYRSDLYSFAVMVYQLLVGHTPFHADTPTATLMAHVHQPVPLPEDGPLSPQVRAVLIRALAKRPEDRFSSASGIVEALESALDQRSGFAIRPISQPTLVLPSDSQAAMPLPARGVFSSRRGRWLAAAGGVAVVAAGTLLGVFLAGQVPSGGRDGADGGAATPPAAALAPTGTAAPAAAISVAEIIAAAQAVNMKIDGIQKRVSALRGLHPKAPIETNFRRREELKSLADAYFRRGYLRGQVFEAEELYKTLGLLAADDNLEQLTRGILMEQVFALFDDESGLLYVISDAQSFGPLEELAYASVYMAGLQQQHFDVASLRQKARSSGNSDFLRAVTAFVSGEVFQVQQGYIQESLTEQQAAELARMPPGNLLSAAPLVVRQSVLFPQREGADFVAAIYQAGKGWESVNSVYAGPPQSTEQVMHPEKYFRGEVHEMPALPGLADALGRGWTVLSEDTLGEFLLRAYLEQHLDFDSASSAAAGWGGDRYVLLSGPEAERVLALWLEWDSPSDSREFAQAYQDFMRARTGGASAVQTDGQGTAWWVAQGQVTALRSGTESALLVIADSRRLAERVLAQLPPLR